MNDTKIRWTNFSWNVFSGCVQVSPGCANCYAQRLAEQKRGTPAFPHGFDLTYRWHKLRDPFKLKMPSRIFVNSMSDLYFEPVAEDDIQRVFDVMNECYAKDLGHSFQILTKRSKRLVELAPRLTWTPNIWQGVSVENQRWTSRIADLVQVPAAVRFLSVEPLLGAVDLSPYLPALDWVIVGGESGPGFRPMKAEWARAVRDACLAAGTAFYYKQGAAWRTEMFTTLDGETWEQYPDEPPFAERTAARQRAYGYSPSPQAAPAMQAALI